METTVFQDNQQQSSAQTIIPIIEMENILLLAETNLPSLTTLAEGLGDIIDPDSGGGGGSSKKWME